jgi:hypothetical protein
MELMLPERLEKADMLGFLEDGFEIAKAVMFNGRPIEPVARRAGYQLVMSEDMTPVLRLDSFVHAHDGHRLILNTHRYPGFTRRVMHLMLPGGVAAENLGAFRARLGIGGETHDWRGHVYGEWCLVDARRDGQAPIFIETRQDVLQGEAIVLRTVFHHVAATWGDA